MKSYLIFLVATLVFCLEVSGQKHYDITVRLATGVSFDQIEIFVDDGRTQKQIEVKNTQSSRIRVSGTYYSMYALIKFTSPKPNIRTHFFENRFFVTDKPAVITLKKAEPDSSPFEKYSLVNALDFKTEKEKMAANSAREEANRSAFVVQHDKEIRDGSDTVILNEYFRLNKLVGEKDLDYVLKNGDSYLGFSFFRRNLLNWLPPDSMLKLFNKTFPAKFRNSGEGKYIESNLMGKILVSINNTPPNFSAKDITGKKVSLYSFRKKKFVLLTFWATWCGPCINEMPQIRALHERYGEDMEIISIAYPSTYKEYLQAVKEHGMTWTNIYADAPLLNSYGGAKGIPRVYLIDMNGKIIYDNSAGEKPDMELEALQAKLSDVIPK